MMLTSSSAVTRFHRAGFKALKRSTKRCRHDLITIGPETNPKPVYTQGVPGYSSVSGHVATVFGATGFLGRYLVAKLAKAGTQVIIPYRDEDEKRHLKLMGDLGQIVNMEWNIRSDEQTLECVRHSSIVYNLVGRNYETKHFSFRDVHVDGAARIAAASRDAGVPRLVHVSHLNASQDSPSAFYQTKAEGEEAVIREYGRPVIVRPGAYYGHEDKLLNNVAGWPIWWKLNGGRTKTRPVHVMDVAQALSNLLNLPAPLPTTLNLPGPSEVTHKYLLDLVHSVSYRKASRAPEVPKRIAKLISRASELVWWPALSPDEVERRYIDDVSPKQVGLGDWDVVGVKPSEIEDLALKYLRGYRSADDYRRPLLLPKRVVPTSMSQY